jgi:hypothetical protein
MPRVENVGNNVYEWNERTGDGSSVHDVCQKCYKKLGKNPHVFDGTLRPYQFDEPQGTEGWQGDVEHPPYEDEGWQSVVRCKVCQKKLTERDNNVQYP